MQHLLVESNQGVCLSVICCGGYVVLICEHQAGKERDQFADSQKSRFQASKRSNMGSAVPEVGRSADFQEFCFFSCKTLRYGLCRTARGSF